MRCPRCGREMEEGVIAGHSPELVWMEKPPVLMFYGSGERLSGGLFDPAPFLMGSRCRSCRLILASY